MRLCDSIFIGCYKSCGEIVLPLVSQYSDIHTLEYYFLDSINCITFASMAGMPFTLPSVFNETSISTFRIKQPDGEYYTVSDGCKEYSSFKVKSFLARDLNEKFCIADLVHELKEVCECKGMPMMFDEAEILKYVQ